jgi:NADP-dependent 3-hydroxy acid dehydrogenase YdfG
VLITGCDSGFGYELALHLEKMVGKKVSLVGYTRVTALVRMRT